MTAATKAAPAKPHRLNSGTRLIHVVRLHLANRTTYVWVPLIVVSATYFVSLALYGVLRLGMDEGDLGNQMYGIGGLQFVPFYYAVTVGIQAMMYTYPFAMAMSLTRREYINGTTALAALFALSLASVYALGRAVEWITDGYFIGFYYFGLFEWFWGFAWWQELLFLTGLALLLFMAGFACTTVFKRGGVMRLVVVLVAWMMGFVAALALVTWQEWWPRIGYWVFGLTPGTAGGWMLVAAAALSLGAYRSIRKAVP